MESRIVSAMLDRTARLAFLLLTVGLFFAIQAGPVCAQDKVPTQNRKLRVLLFIDGPNREFQFVRNFFARHPEQVDFFVYAKNPGFNPDVEQERGLKEFPSRLGPDSKDKKGMSLSSFDLVIAFDPDWTDLKAEQIKLLEQWVNREAGGLILVAGPVHTHQLATNANELRPVKEMLPVVLTDARLRPEGVDMKTPYALNFTARAQQYPFLNLSGEDESYIRGWNRFFWGEVKKPAKDAKIEQGIYRYYPVDTIRLAATVLATFAGPKATRINDGRDEQPFFVTMPHGNGKTFYIGSGETWRLRQYKEAYHERFWLKLTSYMSAGDSKRDLAQQKALPVLIIDGDPVRAKESAKSDSYYVKLAIDSIPTKPFAVVLGHELAGGNAAQALERDDLSKFGAILLLNVRDLKDTQLANLEKYAAEGGGVAFFLGPKVSSTYYNENLFKQGKGLFPVPLDSTYYPPREEAALKREVDDGDMVLLRFDLFRVVENYPVFGPIFRDPSSRGVLKDMPIKRYFKVPRDQWRPDPARVFELATLPNDEPVTTFQKAVLEILYSQQVKAILEDPANKKFVPGLLRHRTEIVVTVAPTSVKKNHHLAQALENLLRDRGQAKKQAFPDMNEFWASKDAKIQKLHEEVAGLLNKARYGDPLVVGGLYGKGKVLAVMTSAGPDWNDWPVFGKCLGSFVYQPFIWESINYLSGRK